MSKLSYLKPALRTMDTRPAKPEPKRADAFYLSPKWRKLTGQIATKCGRRREDPYCDGVLIGADAGASSMTTASN